MAVDVQPPHALGTGIALDWQHLIDAARILAGVSGGETTPGRPRQAMLKRAVSTAYYAMFHALCESNADALVGPSPSRQDLDLWIQTYRALDHRAARERLARVHLPEIHDFASVFRRLQADRLEADYNPRSAFTRQEVVNLIDRAEAATQAFVNLPARPRRMLATHLLVARSRG